MADKPSRPTTIARSRPAGWLALTLPALLLGTVSCGSGNSAASGTTSSAQPPASPASSAAAAGKTADAKTPAAAVTAWVTAILEKRYTDACLMSAASAPPGTDVAAECAKPTATRTLTSLHDAWAKPGIKLPPESQVKVTDVKKQGDSATVSDASITVDGHTLKSLMLIGATGNADSFGLTLTVQQHDGKWSISDMKMGF